MLAARAHHVITAKTAANNVVARRAAVLSFHMAALQHLSVLVT